MSESLPVPTTPETPKLPAVPESLNPLGEDVLELSGTSKIELRIDNGKIEGGRTGTWNFTRTSLAEIQFVFVARISPDGYRKLFVHDIDEEVSEEEKGRVACMSLDALRGYGHGGRNTSEPIQERICQTKSGGRKTAVCPATQGKGRDWICRPMQRYMLLISLPESGVWSPAIFVAKGLAFTPFKDAWEITQLKAYQSGKDASGRPLFPLWAWKHYASLKRWNKGNLTAYEPAFGMPEKLGAPNMPAILDALQSAALIWQADRENLEAQLRSIGMPTKQVEGGLAQKSKEDYGEIPF